VNNFPALYERTNKQISQYVFRRISFDVEDVVDDIYTIAWRKREDIPNDHEEALLWLYAIGRKVIANKVRWKSRLDRFNKLNNPLVAAEARNGSPRDNWVQEALISMPVIQREALMLVEWDGLCIAEAAEVLGVPGTTVTKRLHSAREVFAKNYSVIEEREK
jgi:DNA-directed RNA polymerase specialized sigma24 family protein